MNKKSLILLASIGLLLLAFFILRKNTGNTLDVGDRDFEFKSTDKINKIFINNKFNHEYVILNKSKDGKWTVNDSFAANPPQVDVLLECFRKMRVKRPVSKHEIGMVTKDLALNGIKVEIYENNNLSKVYYVGTNTRDELGTYFLMENGKEPFVCHIPGFNGYLSARYFTKLDGWRSKNIFALKSEDIASISVQWTETPKSSFVINNTGKEPIFNADGHTYLNNTEINLNKLRSYLNLWENLSFEGFPIDLDPHKIDSISHTIPIMVIKVIDKNKKETTLTIHKKGIKRDSNIQFDKEGNPLPYDIENFYAFINGSRKEVVQIQDYIFGKVMKQAGDFMMNK